MNIKKWEEGKNSEMAFWEQWLKRKGVAFQEKRRLSSLFDFMIGPKKEVTIANLGAGAMNLIGEHRRDVEIKVIASDMLADEFALLRKRLGITSPIPVESQDMTKLNYRDNSFDIVYCANALDHAQDPYKALQEMVRVCKLGGWIYLSHMAHEGRRQGYRGLHQWNIDITQEGDCIFWNRDGLAEETFLLSDVYNGFTTQAKPTKKAIFLSSFTQKK